GGDPPRLRQTEHDRAIQTSGRPEVEILHGGLLAQLGRLEPQRQTAAIARFGFAVDQQTESLVEAQVQVLVRFELLAQPEHHAPNKPNASSLSRVCVSSMLRPPSSSAGSRPRRAGWRAESARFSRS